MYIFVENRQYFVNEERQKQPAKNNNDLDEVFHIFFLQIFNQIRGQVEFYFDCRGYQNQETPANPLPGIGLQCAPTFYKLFIFCIIRYDSDTLYTVYCLTLARTWGGGGVPPLRWFS